MTIPDHPLFSMERRFVLCQINSDRSTQPLNSYDTFQEAATAAYDDARKTRQIRADAPPFEWATPPYGCMWFSRLRPITLGQGLPPAQELYCIIDNECESTDTTESVNLPPIPPTEG